MHISRSKSNQAMKCSQLIEYNVKKCFFVKSHVENEAGRLVPGLFLFFKKLYIRSKQEVSTFGRPPLGHAIKTNCITFQTVDSGICSSFIIYRRVWD